MKKALNWLTGILIALIVGTIALYLVLRFGFGYDVFDRGGWRVEDGQLYYLDYSGDPLTGWQTVGEDTYYLDPAQEGAMVTGWLVLDGQRYWLDGSGRLCTNWTDTDRGRFYLQEDGAAVIGWYTAPEGTYYFREDSGLVLGWQMVEGVLRYFNDVGQLQVGWAKIGENRYYFAEDGTPVTGWVTVDGNRYWLGENGILTGWQTLEGSRYCFDETGAVRTGWYAEEDRRYYFSENGGMVTGWLQLETGRYYLGEDGVAHTGWLELEGDRYYLREDGTMAVGEVVLDGVSRFFTSTGKYVVLVNQWHLVPEDYVLNMVDVEGFSFDAGGAEALLAMLEACREAGFQCEIDNTYRSESYQQYLWNVGIDQRMADGMSYEKAKEVTGQRLARVGASEHHLGLAVDLDCSDEAYEWLIEHCWDYGFILRYPDGKTEATGIIYEPWHFRYVGMELAQELKTLGLCMEEYMDMLTAAQGAEPVPAYLPS